MDNPKPSQTNITTSHQELFTELLQPYLRQEEPLKIPDDIEKTIRLNLAKIIKKTIPELSSKEEEIPALAQRVELKIVPDDPTHAKLNEAIIKAYTETESLRNFIKKEHKERFDALFDTMLTQFAPDPNYPKAAGAYGWGLDVALGNNDYRIVVYAPETFDSADLKTEKTPPASDGNPPPISFIEYDHGIKTPQVATRGDKYEHGPAHVHVIDKKNGRESKFELIENPNHNGHLVKKQQSDNPFIEPLHSQQVEEIAPVIKDLVPNFTTLWRRFYENTPLAAEVTCVSDVFPDFIARTQLEVDDKGNQSWMVKLRHIKNASNRMTIPLEDYQRLPKGASRPRTSYELAEEEILDHKFMQSLLPFLSAEPTETLPAEIKADILRNALQLYNSGYSRKQVIYHARNIDLAVDAQNPDNEGHTKAVIEACKQSQPMRKLVKSRHIDRYQQLYLELLHTYFHSAEPIKIPEVIESDVKLCLAEIIKKTIPEMTSKEEKISTLAERISLTITPDNPDHEKLNAAIIAACKQSEALRRYIKQENKARFDALFDEILLQELSKERVKTLPHDIQVEVKNNAATLLNKHHFEAQVKSRMAHEPAKEFDLTLYPDSPEHAQNNYIIIEACRLSREMAALLEKRRSNYTKPNKDTDETSKEDDLSVVDTQDDDRTIIPRPRIIKKKEPKLSTPQKPVDHTHDPDPDKLTLLDFIAYQKSLTPQQRKDMRLEIPSPEEVKLRKELKKCEISYIKTTESPETHSQLSPNPYFLISKKIPQENSYELRVFKLCEHLVSDSLTQKQRSLACEAIKELIGRDPWKSLESKNPFSATRSMILFISLHFPNKPDSLNQFMKKLADKLEDGHPTKAFSLPQEIKVEEGKGMCLIKNIVPAEVRQVFKEQFNLIDEDLDAIKIVEQQSNYRVEIPLAATPAGDTSKGLEQRTIEKRYANMVGDKLAKILHTQVKTKSTDKSEVFSQPYLFIPKSVITCMGVIEPNADSAIRDIIQATLGLKDEQLTAFKVAAKGDYYRVRIPDIATQYDAISDDPELTNGRAVKTVMQTRFEIAEALREGLAIHITHPQEAPIYEKDFAFAKPVAPPSPPPIAPLTFVKSPHELDYSKMTFWDELAHLNSLPEKQRLEHVKDSDLLAVIKKGAIFYSNIPKVTKPPEPTSKRTRAKPKINPLDIIRSDDAIEPFLYIPLHEFAATLGPHSPGLVESLAKDSIRDMLAFTLGLQQSQIGAINVERAEGGSLLKVRIPSITYTYDALTGDPNPDAGAQTISVTLNPSEVAALLSEKDVLGVPIENTPTTALPDSKIRIKPRIAPVVKKTPEVDDPHKFAPQKLTFVEKLHAYSRLSAQQRNEMRDDNPLMLYLRYANTWFIKHNDQSVPYLIISQDIKDALKCKDDAEVEREIRDVFRSTLGLKFHQLSAIKLETLGSKQHLYKVKIPPFTYANEDIPGEAVIETISALEVAKIFEKTLGTRVVGSIAHPNQESRVKIIAPRDYRMSASPPKKEASVDTEETPAKPTRILRFTDFIKRKVKEAGSEPPRYNPFDDMDSDTPSDLGYIRFMKEGDGTHPYIFLPKHVAEEFKDTSSIEQKSDALCEFMASRLDDEQKKSTCTALNTLLDLKDDTQITPSTIGLSGKTLTDAIIQKYPASAEAFETLLENLKKEKLGEKNPLKTYNSPNIAMENSLRDMIQEAMDLSDSERSAIEFDPATFSKAPPKIRLPSVRYSSMADANPAAAIQDVSITEKTFSATEVAHALSDTFDIPVRHTDDAPASIGKKTSIYGKGGAKGGR